MDFLTVTVTVAGAVELLRIAEGTACRPVCGTAGMLSVAEVHVAGQRDSLGGVA